MANLHFPHQGELFINLAFPVLIEHALKNKEGLMNNQGALVCQSGKYTGRSPKDKFFVQESSSQDHIWWGSVNQKLEPSAFQKLTTQVFKFLGDKKIYLFDGYAGADPKYRIKVRFITTKAWHAFFVYNMFIRPSAEELENFQPDFTVYNACEYSAENWKELKLNSEVFVAFDIGKKIGLIGGTEYAGEMKKGIFSIMNYLLPLKQVMAMHCSATVGEKGDVAVYFGLSGTGKTTLSADPERILIGDDEHGWSDDGVFNFEGGCYAKTIKLSPVREKEIWNAIRFGSLLENVAMDQKTREVDFENTQITENTRVSYPIEFMPRITKNGMAGHPNYVIMLTCDAFGVLPPVSQLTPDQANYHFLSGYTAKVAGTERGVTEPTATFSTCFGKPFMTLNPKIYGNLLAEKMRKHKTKAYLVNTGWVGKGDRIPLPKTRKIIHHILSGTADKAEYFQDPVFGFSVPKSLPGLEADFLNPAKAWGNQTEYEKVHKKLAQMFMDNFKQFSDFAATLSMYGPKI